MASFTINGGATFPEGTSVSVYPRTAWGVEGITGAPSGSAAAGPVTITGGTATFTGLADNTEYVAYASSSGRYKRFSTPPPSAGLAATDARYQPQSPALVLPALVDTALMTSVAATVANRLCGVRAVMPRTGTLRDLTVYIGTSSGNLIGTVYDTGDALAGSRTKLWDSGSVLAAGTNAWQTVGDPNLAVTAGQQLDLGFVPDNGTVTFGRATTTASTTAAVLPGNFFIAPGGATPKLSFNMNLGSFAAPATITEANVLTQSTSVFMVIARIS